MSAAATAFAAQLPVPPSAQADADTAEAPRTPPAARRLPRAVLLTGVAVVGAALIGGAFLVAGTGDVRSSAKARGAVPDPTGGGGPYESTPSRPGSAPPSVSASASGASPHSPITGSATDGGTRTPEQTQPSATLPAGVDHADTGSDSGDQGTVCSRSAGSGPITGYSVCAAPGTVTLRATFHTSQSYYHAFINTDGDTSTGYQLPYPSPSVLGADYMIENGALFRSRSTRWDWTEVTSTKMKLSGSTRTWTLSLSKFGSPTGTQRVEFHAGSDYTPVITFSPR